MMRLSLAALPLLAVPTSCALFATPSDTAVIDDDDDEIDVELWEHCPTPQRTARALEDALWVQFGYEALYCSVAASSWNGSASVWDQLAAKAQLRLVPGDHFLPLEEGAFDVTLPTCAQLEGGATENMSFAGELVVERQEQLGKTRVTVSYEQPLLVDEEAPLTLALRVAGYEEALARGVLLDGQHWPAGDPTVLLALCRGATCAEALEVAELDACRFEAARETWSLDLVGGELVFEIDTDGDENRLRGHLVSARGTLDGSEFDVTSYWNLLARETWPFSTARDFAVRLDPPAGNTCGIVVSNLYPESSSGYVELVSCDDEPSREYRTLVSSQRTFARAGE